MAPVLKPYTREHMKEIRRALREIHDWWPVLQRMEDCRFPQCEELREKLQLLQEQFSLILKHFGGEEA